MRRIPGSPAASSTGWCADRALRAIGGQRSDGNLARIAGMDTPAATAPRASYDLRRDGFTILHAVHSPARVREAREQLAQIIGYAELALEDPFGAYYLRHRSDQGALYDVLQRHPGFWDIAQAPAVLDAIASELGEDLFMYENSVVYKPKGKRNAVPYHQDFISRPEEPRKLIAWTALDDVTIETGAMRVLPGSHVHGFLPWHRVKGETHHDRILPEALPDIEPQYAVLAPGDVLVFNQLLVHGSDEVHTDSLRVAFRVSYQGFDRINVPRGSPIVLRGGDPAALQRRFPRRHDDLPRPKVALWRRGLRKVGRVLSRI